MPAGGGNMTNAPGKPRTSVPPAIGREDAGTEWVFDPLPSRGNTLIQPLAAQAEEVSPALPSNRAVWVPATGDRFDLLFLRLTNAGLHYGDSLLAALAREREAGNHFNLVPVVIGAGILTYFAAGFEPLISIITLSAMLPALLAWRLPTRGPLYYLSITAMLFFLGMLAAQFQIKRTEMPIPSGQITGSINGTVLAVDQNRRGAPRYLIRPDRIEGLTVDQLPRRIRLSAASSHTPFAPGTAIAGLARLRPISGAAYPGGYDFGFFARLDGLGLSGFFMGAPRPGEATVLTWRETATVLLQRIRGGVTERIRTGLKGEAGDVAAALITGDRSGLAEATQESLRRAGLAHILAISGLHMALVTLTIVFLIRLILVLIPGFSWRYPIKKWALAAGFAGATLYLLLSGASIATQRAWIMISVMLMASLLDRRAITMRSVAVAATLILLIDPASLFQPGFQMSFAAVAALVAVYRAWSERRFAGWQEKMVENRGIIVRFATLTGRYFTGLAVTSLVAGLATTLFAVWHFHRVAPLGLIANLLAMPIVSIFVMPLSLLSMMLMPYGFEALALAPLGLAIEAVIGVADAVNAYGADFETGRMAPPMLALAAGGLILACAFHTWLRALALVPLALLAVVIVTMRPPPPDLIIAEDGRGIAVRASAFKDLPASVPMAFGNPPEKETLLLPYPRRSRFITGIWQRAFAPNSEPLALATDETCDRDQCHFRVRGVLVSIIYAPPLLKPACRRADILIAPRLWWVNCRTRRPALVLKRGDFEHLGTHSLWIDPAEKGRVRVTTARRISADGTAMRPWLRRFELPLPTARSARRGDGKKTGNRFAPLNE